VTASAEELSNIDVTVGRMRGVIKRPNVELTGLRGLIAKLPSTDGLAHN
jgi:hypothetical protein